jgi:hypothetical protein
VVNMLTASGHFEKVERKAATSHRNTGDVVAIAFPTIALSASSDSPAVVPRSVGQHGALNAHRELHTVLFAAGFGRREARALTARAELRHCPLAGSPQGARLCWSIAPSASVPKVIRIRPRGPRGFRGNGNRASSAA